MMYAVVFEDDPDKAAMRARHMQEHLAFLQDHAGSVQAAGPMSEAVSGAPAGGLWLVDAASAGEVQALVEADPFWSTGLRKSARILLWKQVFANGERLIEPLNRPETASSRR
ncbi:MAG: YciI family protein [Gammaproteobacteria bacterium]